MVAWFVLRHLYCGTLQLEPYSCSISHSINHAIYTVAAFILRRALAVEFCTAASAAYRNSAAKNVHLYTTFFVWLGKVLIGLVVQAACWDDLLSIAAILFRNGLEKIFWKTKRDKKINFDSEILIIGERFDYTIPFHLELKLFVFLVLTNKLYSYTVGIWITD